MAKECCNCGSKLGLWGGTAILEEFSNYVLCEECFSYRMKLNKARSDEEYRQYYAHFSKLMNNPSTPEAIKDKIDGSRKNYLEVQKTRIEKETHKQRVNDLMVTTGNSFEGYCVKKYIGIVSKHTKISHGFKNIRKSSENASEIGMKEVLEGFENETISNLTELAENMVMNSISESAVNRGANAILGLHIRVDYVDPKNKSALEAMFDMEVYISVYGTAVYIEKEDFAQ